MLEVKKLKKSFAGRPVLRALSLSIEPGSLSVLIGRSGCGKSTLLRCLNGLEQPESGSVQISGLKLEYPQGPQGHPLMHSLRRKLGMVFQSFNLFPHLSVEANIMIAPRQVGGISHAEAKARAEKYLAKVGLLSHRQHYPAQLSGGQQQRAAIARALAMQPEILLYDEPTSSLDPHLSKEVLQVMLELKKEGMTQVLVTHEHAFAARAADRVFFIEDGKVFESGSARQLFKAPKHARTKRFVKGLK
jgi:ABC-type polar amino acid transport system ATPase subunit